MKVLVTDGENRSALAITRSLGRKGYDVFVSSKESRSISASSKYCRKAFKVPDPLYYRSIYLRTISEIVNREKVEVIVPTTEQSICCLNKARDQLGKHVVLACATHEKMEAVSNKYRLFQMAEKLGVAIPRTIYVTGVDDFREKRSQISDFPVVVKPAYSKTEEEDKIISAGVMYAANNDELSRLYDTRPVLRHASLIQELIVGDGAGLFTLFDHDRHLALFSHRRLLEKPPSGGVSVLSESVLLDEEMVESAEKLLSAVDWQGIAMVEFKRDARDGKAKLMEINGRFWGSLQLSVSAGMDFPTLCLDYYLDNKPASLLADYNVGYMLKWWFGILDHLIIRMKYGDRLITLPPESPTCWQVIRDLLKTGDANVSFDVYDSQDIGPFVSEIRTYIKNIICD